MYSLAKLSDVKTHLPIRAGVTTYDEKLKNTLRMATMQIESATRCTFGPTTKTEFRTSTVNGGQVYDMVGNSEDGANWIAGQYRVPLSGTMIDPDSIELRYDPSGRFEASSIAAADQYSFEPSTNELVIFLPTIASPRGLKITYSSGYEVEVEAGVADANWKVVKDIPFDLQQGCVLQALVLWHRTSENTIGLDSDQNTKSKAKFTPAKGLDPDVVVLVAKYRKISMGVL